VFPAESSLRSNPVPLRLSLIMTARIVDLPSRHDRFQSRALPCGLITRGPG